MVSDRSGGGEAASGRSPFLSPEQARQDAADRRVGRVVLRVLQVIGVATALVFGVVLFVADPDVGGIRSRALDMVAGAVFVLPGIAGLVATIVCRRPASQQVSWLPETVAGTGFLSALMGGVGVVGGLYGEAGAPPSLVVLCGVALVSGVATMVLRRRLSWKRPVK